ITVFDPATEASTNFGSAGTGEGQFNEATGIGVGAGLIFVCDRDNHRVQVFDLDGKFIRQWGISGWERGHFPDVVYDEANKHLYVSDGRSNSILVFDTDGNPLPPLALPDGVKLANPSALVITDTGK